MYDKDKLKIILDETVKAILSVSNNVEKIILFGSQARGDSVVGSDVDILVIVDLPEDELLKVKYAMRNLTSDISLEYDEVVSLIVRTKEEYETMGQILFYKNVAKDGIVLYKRILDDSQQIYTVADIREKLLPVFERHKIKKAVLFGSYAKGIAKGNSDIDIMVESNLRGLAFYGLLEYVVNAVGKSVDLLDKSQIIDDSQIQKEIEETGIVIFENK